jgi:tRNA (guanine-N7-)-methyltransferase
LSTPASDVAALFPIAIEAVRLEIGFGAGEHLLHEARTAPRIGLIGVEPFLGGLAKAVAAIEREQIPNVRLFDQDAERLLDWLPARSIDRISLLFPDPWPKRRHHKRRFVKAENLDRIVRVLAANGELRFATDIEDYAEWAISEVAMHGALRSTASSREGRHTPWAGWPGTRYEAKALAAGRQPYYLTFAKA